MKSIIISKKHIIAACCILLTLTLTIICAQGTFASNNKKLPIYCVETEKKQIAISFDAAWGNDKNAQNSIL